MNPNEYFNMSMKYRNVFFGTQDGLDVLEHILNVNFFFDDLHSQEQMGMRAAAKSIIQMLTCLDEPHRSKRAMLEGLKSVPHYISKKEKINE